MNQKQMIAAVRATGCTVRVVDAEIRINLPGSTEATAYYTNDRADAVATAEAMAQHSHIVNQMRAQFGDAPDAPGS